MHQENFPVAYSQGSFDERNYSSRAYYNLYRYSLSELTLSAVAALVVLILDIIASCRSEYVHIWGYVISQGSNCLVSWTGRFGLTGQVAHGRSLYTCGLDTMHWLHKRQSFSLSISSHKWIFHIYLSSEFTIVLSVSSLPAVQSYLSIAELGSYF
jgi:hypothetical protein